MKHEIDSVDFMQMFAASQLLKMDQEIQFAKVRQSIWGSQGVEIKLDDLLPQLRDPEQDKLQQAHNLFAAMVKPKRFKKRRRK